MARTSSAKDISRILTLVVAVVVIAALYFARVMLVPLALAVLFTFVLAPLVSALERIRIPRFIAIFLVVGIAVFGVGVMGWTVGNQLIDVTNQLPSYKTNIKEKIDSIRNPKNRRLDKAADAMKELGKEITDAPSAPNEPSSALKLRKRQGRTTTQSSSRASLPASVQSAGISERRDHPVGKRRDRRGVDNFHACRARRFEKPFDWPGRPRSFEFDDPGFG